MKTPRPRVSKRPADRTRRRHLHPRLEGLETRELLSMTITVNSNADTDDPTQSFITLREAIELSNGTLTVSQLSATAQNLVVVYPTATPAPGAPPVPNTIEFNLARENVSVEIANWGDGSTVPTSGNNLVVVGLDSHALLNIRYFDAAGNATNWTQSNSEPTTILGAIADLGAQVVEWGPPSTQSVPASVQSDILSDAQSILRSYPEHDDLAADRSTTGHHCAGHDRRLLPTRIERQ